MRFDVVGREDRETGSSALVRGRGGIAANRTPRSADGEGDDDEDEDERGAAEAGAGEGARLLSSAARAPAVGWPGTVAVPLGSLCGLAVSAVAAAGDASGPGAGAGGLALGDVLATVTSEGPSKE
jgi:hypothetical protein